MTSCISELWRDRWKVAEGAADDPISTTEQILRMTLLELLYARRGPSRGSPRCLCSTRRR